MGYTLQTVGNAISLTYGPQAMPVVAERSDFPLLAANLRDRDGPLVEDLKEYALIPLPAGLKMGVIGLTAPWGNMYELFDLRLPDFRDVARRLVDTLRSEGASLIVVLSHLGLDDDRRLAEAVSGIDLIVGGHSHDRLPAGEECHDTLIAHAGEYAEVLGRVDLSLDPSTGQILSKVAALLEVPADESADPPVLVAIAAAEEEAEVVMARQIGVLEEPLSLDHYGECGIGNLAADALQERMGAERAIVCSGMFHADLPAGMLTLGQLDAACFSTANPYVSEVTGAQIQAALEKGLDPAISENMHHSFRGVPVGIPQISGMRVEYNPDAEPGRRVRRIEIAGRPLEPHRTYRLAHTDAETIPNIGYLTLEEGQPSQSEMPTILREVIEDYVRAHSPLPSPAAGRWVQVP